MESMDNRNIEPVTDLGLVLGYSNQCIQRKLNGDSGAGANAGSRIHMAFVATNPLSELVWDTDKGVSNVTLSPPQSNKGGRSAADKPIDDEDFITAQTSFRLKSEFAGKDMTISPTSNAGVMPLCGSSHDTGTVGNVEEEKAAVELSVLYNQEGTYSQANIEVNEIPQIPETRENFITTLTGNGDREGADILLVESDQKIPFVEQNEPLLGDPVDEDKHADVGDQKMQMDLVLASEVHPVNESKASGVPVVNKKAHSNRPLNKLEATAENDLMTIKIRHAYGAASQILGPESVPGVKDRFDQGQEMVPGNESVLDRHYPNNSRIHMHQRKGKEKFLSDGDPNGRMPEDETDSHESVESCNSAGLFTSGKKRWRSEEEFIVGSKRFRKKIQEAPISTSYIRQDSSFMNWISSMVKGFSKSMQDEAPPLALTLAHPDHGDENPDNKRITCNTNQDDGVKSIGFQTIFRSLYCPTADCQEARMLSDNHKKGEISTELEPDTSPKVYRGENVNLGQEFLLSVEKFNISSSGNEVHSAGSQEKCHTGSENKKNPCNFPFYKRKDRVIPNCCLDKHKKRRVENVESSSQFKGKTTGEIGYRRDLLGSLWITRLTPKTSGPSLIADHSNKSADGVLESSNDLKNMGAREQFAEDLVIVIGNNLQNCAADNEGSSAFNRNKGQNDQASMSEFSPIMPCSEVRSSEGMASVFARRLDALKNITPPAATGNAADEITMCLFCGIKGHHLQECSQIRQTELQELLSKSNSYNVAENLPFFCIRCLQQSHWAAACPNAQSMGQPQLECNVSFLDYYCSQSGTNLNSRNDGNMKFPTGTESQFEASVAHTCFNEDYSRMETDINMSWKDNAMGAPKKRAYRSNSVVKCSASSSVENKYKENQMMPLSKLVNTQISNVPKGIVESVKRLRLSRTDVLKWMDSRTSLSQLEGFFLRLRLRKWEEGLGGTGYHVSCITGSQRESCPQNVKDSIAVVVGGIRCMVKSKYISNNDFHEDELRAWWSATSKGSDKIPSEEDLREKVKRKRMLGL
ncbi:uncharacterized protein LOC103967246 isoform X1 [Pyrus x bretschneideri]|uniref:uncharacterized protein LOC103967246 isoform X1 n=2 Tax=Pyrus x bretschneideri TaxID=225117 RepID=UPI00202F5222|nr:uncharacterized protein LOC103967246 isoform X1 [Pyrus x bretschneideri]